MRIAKLAAFLTFALPAGATMALPPNLKCEIVTHCFNPSRCEATTGELEVALSLLPSSASDSHNVLFEGEQLPASLNETEDTVTFIFREREFNVTLLTGFGFVLLGEVRWLQRGIEHRSVGLSILDCD